MLGSYFGYNDVAEFQIHHEIAQWAVNVPTITLHCRVVWSVDQVDGDGVDWVVDIVGRVEGLDFLVAGSDRPHLPHIGRRSVQT